MKAIFCRLNQFNKWIWYSFSLHLINVLKSWICGETSTKLPCQCNLFINYRHIVTSKFSNNCNNLHTNNTHWMQTRCSHGSLKQMEFLIKGDQKTWKAVLDLYSWMRFRTEDVSELRLGLPVGIFSFEVNFSSS